MNPDDTSKNAVNWEHGMLLTPDHFLRQERYLEASLLWILRYTSCAFGLVGGGARLPESELGAVRHDPIVHLAEDDQTLRISVTQCRGLTPIGTVIDVQSNEPVHREFGKADLEGITESRIYLIAEPFDKEVTEGPVDDSNPQMQTERKPAYRIALKTSAATSQHAISVALLRRRTDSVTFEKDSSYIPPCISLASYSELTAAWRRIIDEIAYLTERSIELHRAMQEYIVLSRERGIDTGLDHDALAYVSRIVPSLQFCLYDCLDPIQPPLNFFGHLRKLFHGAAISLDLSPPVQQYFDTLKEAGETEFVPLIEQQRRLLRSRRRFGVDDDLSAEVRSALASIRGLQALERALEGKYIDFRISRTLEAMNFVFDRGGRALFKLMAKPARLQGFGEDSIFYFTGLRLEGRDKYRLILSRGDDSHLEPGAGIIEVGSRIPIDLRINEGAGFDRAPLKGAAEVRMNEQRNFEFDFDAPDVLTISDLRVSVPLHFGLKVALLFVRYRLRAETPGGDSREEYLKDKNSPAPPAEPAGEYGPGEPGRYPLPQVPEKRGGSPAFPGTPLAPWDRRDLGDEHSQEKHDRVPPPRRRRLE